MGKGGKHTDFQKKTPRESVLEKNDSKTYTATCKGKATGGGFLIPNTFADGRPRFEVHHILCEISMSQRFDDYADYDKDTVEYIENCLWITPWDINAADNLIGLPRNRRFRVDWVQEDDETKWTPTDLPSHQVDHLGLKGYTIEVRKYLKKVWSKLQGKKGKPHDLDVEQLQKDLEAAQSEFLTRLKGCAARPAGHVLGWKNRGNKAFATTWYQSFSMSQTPTPRYGGYIRGTGIHKAARKAFNML